MEARRIVDHQIESNRHYQRQAGLLLRMLLASVGVFIPVIAYTGVIELFFKKLDAINLQSVSGNLGTELPFLSIGIAGFITGSLLLSASLSLGLGLSEIFVSAIGNSYKALTPRLFDPGFGDLDIEVDPIDSKELVQRYEQSINDNNQKLIQTKTAIDGAFSSLNDGLIHLVIGGISLSALWLNSGFIALLVFFLVIYLYIVQSSEYLESTNYVSIDMLNWSDLGLVLLIAFTWLVYLTRYFETVILSWLMVISMVAIPLFIIYVINEIHSLDYIYESIRRSLTIAGLSIFSVIITVLGLGGQDAPTSFVQFLVGIFIGTFLFLIIATIGIGLRRGIGLYNNLQSSNE